MAIKFLHDLDVSGNIDYNDNQALNMVLQQLTTNPATVVEGKIFQNTTSDKVYVGLNGAWVELSSAIGDITSVIGGTNINVTGGTDGDATVNLDTSVTDAIALNTLKTSNVAGDLTVTAVSTKLQINTTNGTNIPIPAATNTSWGAMSDDLVIALEANTAKTSDINHNVTTNLSEGTSTTTTVDVNSSDGSNATLAAASTTRAGLLSKAKFDEIEVNNAKVSNVAETTTVLSLPGGNVLRYVDEDGTTTNLDISSYLDDTNLARLTSGALNGSTGLATFTRDDASTFTIDMSAFLDAITLNNTLTSTSTTEGLTAAQGKALKDLIDALVTSTGSNTGDEPDASTTVKGIVERATDAEALAGTDTTRYITAAHLTDRGFSAPIGDGTATSIAVSHGLNTKAVLVQMYDTATFETVVAKVVRTSTAVVTASFSRAPTFQEVTIIISKI